MPPNRANALAQSSPTWLMCSLLCFSSENPSRKEMGFVQDITMVYSRTPLFWLALMEERSTWGWITARVQNNSHVSSVTDDDDHRQMQGLTRGSHSSRSGCPILTWPSGFSPWFNAQLGPTGSLALLWHYSWSGSGPWYRVQLSQSILLAVCTFMCHWWRTFHFFPQYH